MYIRWLLPKELSKKWWLFFLLIFALFPSFVEALDSCTYHITSGSKELAYYQIANKIGSASGEAICAKESTGSLENLINLFDDETVVAGLVQSDVLLDASRKHQEKLNQLRLGIPIYQELVHVIVRADSTAQKLSDLGDSVVCVGKPTSGSFFTSVQIKALTNTPWVAAKENFKTCMELLSRNSVDAVFVVTAPPIKALLNKVGSEYRLIPLPSIEAEAYKVGIIDHYPMWDKKMDPIVTISIDTMLVMNDDWLKNNLRIKNKLAIGVASVIEGLDPHLKDSVCTKQYDNYGMALSMVNRQACKLGYFGQDW